MTRALRSHRWLTGVLLGVVVILVWVGVEAQQPARVPLSSAEYYLHAARPTLSPVAPGNPSAKTRTSPAVSQASFQTIGTWTASSVAAAAQIAALGKLHVWLGLRSSGDAGVAIDLHAEVLKNGVVIASGDTPNIQGLTASASTPIEVTVAFGPLLDSQVAKGDTLALTLLAKVADTSPKSKAKANLGSIDLRSLRAIAEERTFKRHLCVSLEPRTRRLSGITVLPVKEFLERLWADEYAA